MYKLRNSKGALNEFFGLMSFVFIVLGLLIPIISELLFYTVQAQEVDRITKMAAKKTCSLLPEAGVGIAQDLREGALGMVTNISVMQRIADSVIMNEAAVPETYFQNTADGRIDLRLYDMIGELIDIKTENISNPNYIEITDNKGLSEASFRTNTNLEGSLCPSGGGENWRYCMDPANDETTQRTLMQTGLGDPLANNDLIQRMQKMQAGRCDPNDPNCMNDYRGRLDHCTVCTTKTRQSIFSRTVFGNLLSCANANSKSTFACSISSCATEKFTQLSGKRGYNTAYQDNSRLGKQFTAREISAQSGGAQTRELLKDETIIPDAFQSPVRSNTTPDRIKYKKTETSKNGEDTVLFYDDMNKQF